MWRERAREAFFIGVSVALELNTMPHARKPKSREAIARKALEREIKPKGIATLNGNKVQVQTRIKRLADDAKRPSVFIKLSDPNFSEQFDNYWKEHIEGFTGLRGSKRERTKKELDMEWRKHAEKAKEKRVSAEEREKVIEQYRQLKMKKSVAAV